MDKTELYEQLVPQVKALIQNEPDLIANLANISSAIHYLFNHHWTGFYLVKGSELVLAPFQGPLACTRIGFGKGVCGAAWKEKLTKVIDDVNQFPGHIACSPYSKSEIVIPLVYNKEVWGVLDIDSTEYAKFDKIDTKYLIGICDLITKP
ncbi:MAG: GAF domain-containing protein [Bacteroidia bacterium]